jgi:adenosylmethionine-8-amino-7-oxononanoate aminotransferase
MRVAERAREMGCILRPLGNVVYYVLPLTTTEEEIDRLVEVTREAIQFATGNWAP